MVVTESRTLSFKKVPGYTGPVSIRTISNTSKKFNNIKTSCVSSIKSTFKNSFVETSKVLTNVLKSLPMFSLKETSKFTGEPPNISLKFLTEGVALRVGDGVGDTTTSGSGTLKTKNQYINPPTTKTPAISI